MADMFDEMVIDKEPGQTVKSNEITGKRFLYHSLPKEYQDWHNNYYIIEKQGPIDNNAVSKAILNGYKWETIKDASFYATLATVTTISAVLKMKIATGLLGFFISAIFFFPVMIYIAFHFAFYAMIRAQVIGPVTRDSAKATTFMFYSTFFGIYISLIVVFVFLMMIAEDLLVLLFMFIKSMDDMIVQGDASTIVVWTYNFLIWFHNFIVEVIDGNGSIYSSIYFTTFVTTSLALYMFYYIENKYYETHSVDIQNDVKRTKDGQKYPIEAAQHKMKEWRAENGV